LKRFRKERIKDKINWSLFFMELFKNFTNLPRSLSAKFPEIQRESSLYLLMGIASHLSRKGVVVGFFGSLDFLNQRISSEVEKLIVPYIENLSDEEIKRVCQYLVFRYLLNESPFYRQATYFFDSNNLHELLAELIAPLPNQTIYNPACRIGSIFVKLSQKFSNFDLRFVGQEPDAILSFLCKFNLFANNIDTSALIYTQNPLDNSIAPYKVDIAVAIPPFGMRFHNGSFSSSIAARANEKIRSSEVAYVELMLSAIREDGKVVVVVPDGFLANSESKNFRRRYVENDWIERVISLPKDTFKPGILINTSIIVFNKNKANKGFIIFDGKEDRFEETKVSVDEVQATGSVDLRPNRYALKESKELRNILIHSPHPVKKIRDLVAFSFTGENFSPNNRITENSSENLPYIRVADLSKNDKDFELDIFKVERKVSRQKARRVIDFSAVLVNRIGTKLKPTYFKFTGQPIVIGSDIIALKMKEDVNIEYFLTQLHSRLVQIQVEMMSSGNIINRISKEDFLNIQIILPPLVEQRLQVFEMLADIEEKAIAQEAVAKAKKQADAIEYEVIANMNHSLKNKLGVIINDYDTLIRFLQRKERTNSPVSFNDPVRPVFEGEEITEVDTIQLITERLKNNLLDTSKVFNTSLKLQTRELKKNPVELVSYFRNELKPLYAGQNFAIEIVSEPKLKLNVLLDKEVFKDAIDNLINNAKSHGFVEKDREYQIIFELSKLEDVYDEESGAAINYARIVYKNNGKPFPKGFSFDDYVRYSSKAGKTQGTGIGGAVIDRIIKLHKGKFSELPTDESSLFSVQFEILLPLDE
jgi:type I restriction enzyme M protein